MGRQLRNAGVIRFGLAPGSADLIGLTMIKIEPHHVGKSIAVFTSIEVKNSSGGKSSPEQENWREKVLMHGGIAVKVSSVEEAEKAVLNPQFIGALIAPETEKKK